LIIAFGFVASGVRTEKKNATGRMIAADGMPERTKRFAVRERRFIDISQGDKGEDEEDAGVGVAGSPEILAKLVGHVLRRSDQQGENADPA